MAMIAKDYFSSPFSSQGIGSPDCILAGVKRCISESMNQELTIELRRIWH